MSGVSFEYGRFLKAFNKIFEVLKKEKDAVKGKFDNCVKQVQSKVDSLVNGGDINQTTYVKMSNRSQQVTIVFSEKSFELSVSEPEAARKKLDDDCKKELSLQEFDCEKNIGHEDFIPIKDYSVKHLPKDIQGREYVFYMVKLYADLTVRIHVQQKSKKRPADIQSQENSEEDEDEGNNSGNGYIFSIQSEYNEFSKKRCRCKKCRESPENASTKWWLLTVYTAQHVLVDDSEAEKARCRLFFDEEPDQATSSQLSEQGVYIDGYKVIHADDKEDRCRFVCVTCDLGLVERLKLILKKISDFNKYIPKHYQKGTDEGKPCFLVSHPHRRAKHITIGKVLCKEGGKYKYDTATCPGSSGAAVYIVGKHFHYFNYVHSETRQESGRNVGISSCGYNRAHLSLKTIHYFKKKIHRASQRLRIQKNEAITEDRILKSRKCKPKTQDNASEVSSPQEQRYTDSSKTATSHGASVLAWYLVNTFYFLKAIIYLLLDALIPKSIDTLFSSKKLRSF